MSYVYTRLCWINRKPIKKLDICVCHPYKFGLDLTENSKYFQSGHNEYKAHPPNPLRDHVHVKYRTGNL